MLLAIFLMACSHVVGSRGFILRVAILHDHHVEEFYETVYNSVHNLLDLVPEEGSIQIESVSFDTEKDVNVYDQLLDHNLTAVIVAAKTLSCNEVARLKKRMLIFIVTGSFESCDEEEKDNSLIYLYPPDSFVLSTMLMAAEIYNWRNAIVLGEKNKEFSFTFTNMQQARARGLDTLAFEITIDKTALRQTLTAAKKDGIRSFILMSQLHHVVDILSMALELDITDKNFHWLIPNVFVDPDSLRPFKDKGMTISLLYSPILTPLIYKIKQKESENATETFLMSEVISSLTLLALDKTIRACQKEIASGCINDENWICRTNPSDVAEVMEVIKTTTPLYGEAESQQTTSSITTTTTTKAAMMHGHMEGDADDGSGASSVIQTTGIPAETTTKANMMHGHMKRSVSFDYEEAEPERRSNYIPMKNYVKSACVRRNCLHHDKGRLPVSVSRRGKKPTTPDTLSRRRRALTNDTDTELFKTPNPECTVLDWDDQILSAASKIVRMTLFPSENKENNFIKETLEEVSLQTLPYLKTDIDSCMFTSIHHWNYLTGSCSLQLVQNAEISLSNSLYVIEYTPLKELAKQGRAVDRQPIIVGAFTSEQRSYMDSMLKPLQLYNVFLPERDLLVGAIYHPPWLSWTVDEMTNETIYSGYLYDLLEQLSFAMNFSYELLHEYDYPGDLHEEKELEAHMVETFSNNSADFFLHAKSVHGNRLGKSGTVQLSASFQQPHMYLITKRIEKTESVSIWQFMMPFREESWIVFWSSFILVSLLLTYYNKNNPNEYQAIAHTFGPNSEPSDHLGILNSLWFSFAAICGQGTDIMPISTACVVLTGTWWGFLLLVVSAYTANMTAFMTQVNSGGIETLAQLAGQQEFTYGMMESSAMLNLFLPEARDEPYTTMFEYFHDNENGTIFHKQKDAFDRVLRGNFYLVAEFETVVDALMESCEFDVKGSGFYQYQFALPFPRGSVYIQMFNDHINKLRDKGTLADLEQKWFTLESRCEKVTAVKNLENQLDIKAFTGMYVFLIIGITGGMIVCAVETGWVKYGGIGGLLGKAGSYEVHSEKKELQKANNLLEKEFESWEGGWDVWKFMEWKEGDNMELKSSLTSPIPRAAQCKTCGKQYNAKRYLTTPRVQTVKENKETFSKPVTQVEVLKDLPKSELTDGKDGKESPDSGRDSACSTQLSTDGGTDQLDASQDKIIEEPSILPQPAQLEKSTLPLKTANPTMNEYESLDPTPLTKLQNLGPKLKKIVVEADMHRPKIPLEALSPAQYPRLQSAQSFGSTSHSSLASGTLSFLSDSDVSVSTIHPRTPFPDSRASSRFAESSLSYDLESELHTPSSFYTNTSYDTESASSRVSSWSRSMLESASTFTSDFTDDTRSDITVISRRRYKK